MTGYYAYIIGDDGHITNRVQIICDNDAEAKRCAMRLADDHAVELWQQARKIERFEPENGVAPAENGRSIDKHGT